MCYIAQKGDLTNLIVEDSNRDEILMSPRYYLEKWAYVFGVTKNYSAESLHNELQSMDKSGYPNYVIFMQEDNIDERVAAFKKAFKNVEYEATIEPSVIDALVHWLNPVNKNQVCYIYKINS